ncbi:MAG: response regulator transcription factor, partial [Hyphomicrobiales bacterium]
AYRQLAAPYLEARSRVLIASACIALGDTESARIDLDAAREVFEQLRAAPDVARTDALRGETAAVTGLPGGLTPREADVLRLLAAGLTNKEIGATLIISEHTVARHVQNMLAKLGCPSRTALAAFAVQHGLAERPDSQN